ncbi:MAG: preprotein translocase subunit SecY [Eubacteriaceae bacterium]|nr:preprotein translocase subunit SecY [Eubacteriaceae bacterium]
MIETLKSAWKTPDIRKKILYTLMMLGIFRLGSHIMVPFIDRSMLANYISSNSMMGLFNIISGDNLKNFSIFAMGITPYINASIIMNLLTIAIPGLENLAKEGGEEGKRKISRYTRYTAIGLAVMQSLGTTLTISGLLTDKSWYIVALVTAVITAGTAFIIWMSEAMTEKGIGNGTSLLIFIGIVSSLPGAIRTIIDGIAGKTFPIWMLPVIAVFMLVTIMGVIEVEEGQRRIPVQYSKRVRGRNMMGGQNSYITMKVNQSGVIPVIFASVITMFPNTLASFFPNSAFLTKVANFMAWGTWFTTIVYVLLIIAFSYFYTAITFNPVDIAKNIQDYGGAIPGIRTGRPTAMYISKISSRLTLFGALFLIIIAIIPIIAGNVLKLNLQFGGTSLLIVVGVALETVKTLEQMLVIRNYKGFLK